MDRGDQSQLPVDRPSAGSVPDSGVCIDRLLKDWPFRPGEMSVRRVCGTTGRPLIQLRIEMGIMQMEVEGRPDGETPHGAQTYLAYLQCRQQQRGSAFRFTLRDRDELDREFLQYYHRRLCLLAVDDWNGVLRDAVHALNLLDWISCFADGVEPKWIESHEQFRPFILAHVARAQANLSLRLGQPRKALRAVRNIYDAIHSIYSRYDIEEALIENDDLLVELREIEHGIIQLIEAPSTGWDLSDTDEAAETGATAGNKPKGEASNETGVEANGGTNNGTNGGEADSRTEKLDGEQCGTVWLTEPVPEEILPEEILPNEILSSEMVSGENSPLEHTFGEGGTRKGLPKKNSAGENTAGDCAKGSGGEYVSFQLPHASTGCEENRADGENEETAEDAVTENLLELEQRLRDAVQREDYERAVLLRNRLKVLREYHRGER